MWLHGPTRVWIQAGGGEWVFFEVWDGLFQGECSSTSVFCLAMRKAIGLMQDKFEHLLLLGYIDDVLLICPVSMLAAVWLE